MVAATEPFKRSEASGESISEKIRVLRYMATRNMTPIRARIRFCLFHCRTFLKIKINYRVRAIPFENKRINYIQYTQKNSFTANGNCYIMNKRLNSELFI